MNRRTGCAVFFLLLIASFFHAGAADAPTVTFFMGKVTLESGGSSVPVKVGQVLPQDGILHTAAGAMIEVRIGAATVTIKEKQVVKASEISSLMKGSAADTPVIIRLMKDHRNRNALTNLAAVRADDKTDKKGENELIWDSEGKPVSVSDQEVFDAINEASFQKDFPSAVLFFEKYIESGSVPGERTIYAAAIAYQQLCSYQKSMELFESIIKSSKNGSLVHSSMVFAGISAFGLSDYGKTANMMSAYLEKEPNGNLAPQALFFRGMSYKMKSQSEKADADFKKLISSFGDDPIAKAAAAEISVKTRNK